jgi:response regulator RpfG family c-di-GMP phosphodiesterase
MKQMETAGFGDSREERSFFSGPPSSRGLVKAAPQRNSERTFLLPQMESAGFGECLEERIFFTGPPSTRDPVRYARLEARKAAAGLLSAFVARGQENLAHCERLAAWSRRLAQELGLSTDRVLDVELGALLHDVGYISLRGIEFSRKGPLTAGEEFELRRHPDLGVAHLRDVAALHRAMPLVAAHHERFDGTGYPRGLRGTENPIDARIFWVVDTYDALTTERAYHPRRLTDTEARAKIEEGLGSQFDPIVYAAFDAIDPFEWMGLVRNIQ